MFHWSSKLLKGLITLIVSMFFINHFAYLSVGQFDYQYNMKANILTGMQSNINLIVVDDSLSLRHFVQFINISLTWEFQELQLESDGSFGTFLREKSVHIHGKFYYSKFW